MKEQPKILLDEILDQFGWDYSGEEGTIDNTVELKEKMEILLKTAFEAGCNYQDGFDFYTGEHDLEFNPFDIWVKTIT